MGDLVATPRNNLIGLLADMTQGASDFAAKPFGYNNPPGAMLSGLLTLPAIANTLNEWSYGGSHTTGSGMTTKPKADAADALVGLLTLATPGAKAGVNAAVRGAQRLEPAINRAVTATMDRGGFPAMALDAMANRTVSPATVWHGSPHKFEKFDASKIGTGEGAQAYGHGLYLADSPDVARAYQNTLSKYGELHFGDGTVKNVQDLPYDSAEQIAGTLWMRNPNLTDAKFALSNLDPKYMGAPKEEVLKQLEGLHNANAKLSGSFYKVDLPDSAIAKMLDWDKPLSQQAPEVQKALEPLGYKYDPQAAAAHDDALLGALFGDSTAPVPKTQMNPMGSDIARGKGIFDQPQDKDIAEKLRQAGIPGIRYLDGGSRGAGAGTSNYVVFPGNENLLTILERNGQPVNGLLGNVAP